MKPQNMPKVSQISPTTWAKAPLKISRLKGGGDSYETPGMFTVLVRLNITIRAQENQPYLALFALVAKGL